MSIEVLMPAISPSERSGRLARWLVAAGDVVRPGDVIAEIETRAATMEVEAVDGGRIARLLVPAGAAGVPAGTAIALIAPAGAASEDSGPDVGDAESSRDPSVLGPGARIKASPLARKRARDAGIALVALRGSGPGGRVLARDVAAFASARETGPERSVGGMTGQAAAQASGAGVVALRPWRGDVAGVRQDGSAGGDEVARRARELYPAGSYHVRAHAPGSAAIADRLVMAQRSVPQATLHADVQLGELQRSLARMAIGPGPGRGRPLSLTVSDVLVKAVGLALRQVPEANVSYTETGVLDHVGADVAVALMAGAERHDEGDEIDSARAMRGVVFPVVAHADLKSLSEIAAEMSALRQMADAGRFAPSCLQGGVTTIYDLSGSRVGSCETLVMPPQSSVVVLGAARDMPVVTAGAITVAPVARLSLGFDQRAFDVSVGLQLIQVVSSYLEDPMRMLV